MPPVRVTANGVPVPPALEPRHLGPVSVYPGRRELTGLLVTNAWQGLQARPSDLDAAARPTQSHASRLVAGLAADMPLEPPDTQAVCAIWRDTRVAINDAMIRVAAPMYVEGLCRSPAGRAAFIELRTQHRRAVDGGRGLVLSAPKGRAIDDGPKTLADGLRDEAYHVYILAAMLADRLNETVDEAARLAGIPRPPAADRPTDLAAMRPSELLPLGGGAVVHFRPEFLNRMAGRFFRLFAPGGRASIPWARRMIGAGARARYEARDTAVFGDAGTSYRYSGIERRALPWSAEPTGALRELLEIVRLVTGHEFNFVLLNLYRPEDSISAHSDDERDLVAGTGIFSVSLGRARHFHLESRATNLGAPMPPVSVLLPSGSAVWMAGRTQAVYTHRVAAEKMRPGEDEPIRVNLTFRCVRPP